MKYLVLFFALIGFFLTLAQEKQVPFPLTTQIEPDYYNRIEKVEDGFITVSKTKGGEFNASEFKLVKFDFELRTIWERELFLNKYENITQIFAADHVNLLINEHNDKEKTSVLKRYSFDLANGKDFKTDTLFQFKVKDWLDYTGKGTVKQTLNSAVCSKQLLHYVTPLEYRYQIRYSPDKNRILLYRFDYGQKTLYTDLKIYDADFNLLEEGIIPVDHMYMVYGYAINNRGEIFIAKANRSGKVALIRYKLALQEFKYLEVEMNNYQRDNLKMYVFSDDIVYLAKMNKTQDKLHSVSYTVFDFESGRLDKYNTYVFTEQKQREIKEKEDELSVNVGDDFRHFVISDFYVNENKEVFFILEEEEIVSNSYKYNEKAVEDIKTWFTEDAQVRTGTLILYKIDADKKLGWSTFVVKDQLANISDGLNIASYKMNFKDDHINLIYAYKKKGILMNSIAYKKFDLNSGKLLVEKDLVNTQKLTLLRPYLYLLDDDLYYVGKKGLVGKKSFFTKQKL